jgi:peptide/nickel transport system substrate-binding protein
MPVKSKKFNLKRALLAAIAVAAASVAGTSMPTPAAAQKSLRVVMHSDLKILDPIWTTAYIVRNHGYMVYDTLFALDEKLQMKPQMLQGHTVSADGLVGMAVSKIPCVSRWKSPTSDTREAESRDKSSAKI